MSALKPHRFYRLAPDLYELRRYGRRVGTVEKSGSRWNVQTPDGRELRGFGTRRTAAHALCRAVALGAFFGGVA